ncbi:MAG: hypothetical protein ACFFAY_07990 [Promethearchaeota archaeon]
MGLAGSTAGLVFILESQLGSVGNEGEPFSIFNHYASELGEVGMALLSWLLNLGMLVSGILFIPFMIGLGLHFGSILATLARAVGVFSSASIVFAGIYPKLHRVPKTNS